MRLELLEDPMDGRLGDFFVKSGNGCRLKKQRLPVAESPPLLTRKDVGGQFAVRAIEKSLMQGGPLVQNGEIPDYGCVRAFWTVAMPCIMSSNAQ